MRNIIDLEEDTAFDEGLLMKMREALTALGKVLTIAPNNRKELDMSLAVIDMTMQHLAESTLMGCSAAQKFHAPFVREIRIQLEDVKALKDTKQIQLAMNALGHFMLARLEAGETPKVLH